MEISHQAPTATIPHEEPVQFSLMTQNRAYPYFVHGIDTPTVTNEYGVSADSNPIYSLPMGEEAQPLPAGAQNLYARDLPLPVPEWKMKPCATDESDDHDYEIL